MVKNLNKMLLCAILFITTGFIAYASVSFKGCNHNTDECVMDTLSTEKTDSILLHKAKDSLKDELISRVTDYINKISPKADPELPQLLVESGLEHNIDIAFMVAQSQYETSFGTAGAGRPTARYSLFGVNGKFDDYEDATNKYISLLQRCYLTKGRTEQHLLKNYTTSGGYRYCSNSNYETKLRGIYNTVVKQTDIRNIQQQYRSI